MDTEDKVKILEFLLTYKGQFTAIQMSMITGSMNIKLIRDYLNYLQETGKIRLLKINKSENKVYKVNR